MSALPLYQDEWIVAQRPPRNAVSANRPYAYVMEKEAGPKGDVVELVTIFLTNRECPFRCLMCDLWKNTLTSPVAPGQIPDQIRWALSERANSQKLPAGEQVWRNGHLKLYNSGNFFDVQAIPPADYPEIAQLAGAFARVIVECHPRLVGRRCWDFQNLLECEFEIAMGLETVHPEVLPRLNKQMTLEDFSKAAQSLHAHDIATRAFILVRPPFMSDAEGLAWAKRSLDFAFSLGVGCCSLIPTRSGNGAMEELERLGQFAPPSLDSLETALEYGLSLRAGRVFVDLWDIDRITRDSPDRTARIDRLARMNLTQSS